MVPKHVPVALGKHSHVCRLEWRCPKPSRLPSQPRKPPQPRIQAGPSLQPQEFAALKVGAERGRLLRGSSRDPGESPGFAGGLTHCGVPCLTAEPGRRPNRAFVLLTDDLLSFRMRARRPECSRCPGDGMRRLPDAVSDRIGLECCDHPSGVLIGLGGGWGALGTAGEELELGDGSIPTRISTPRRRGRAAPGVRDVPGKAAPCGKEHP